MTPQHPLPSTFSTGSTAADVMRDVDMSGKTAIVTGGYSGIGLVTVRALIECGTHVIVPARDIVRAQDRMMGLRGVDILAMDLSDPDSIDSFCADVMGRNSAISLLINSAGIMAAPLARDRFGREMQFATNHLGHFRLLCRLWPALAADGARVVSASSRAHQICGVDFDDIDFNYRPYDKWQAYGQSKTANALFALALDQRGQRHGVRAFSVHPGQIATGLARHLSEEEIAAFRTRDDAGNLIIDPARDRKTVEQGAATSLWCATSAALDGLGGVYCEDCDIAAPNVGGLGRKGVASWATDPMAAERLWELSEAMTGCNLTG